MDLFLNYYLYFFNFFFYFPVDETIENDPETKTLEQQFNAIFEQDNNAAQGNSARDFNKVLKHEFSAFEVSKKRSATLEKLFVALCTIPATSVESERAFSAVGLFVTKLRSSLGDKSIDSLLTLRSYFKKEERMKKT